MQNNKVSNLILPMILEFLTITEIKWVKFWIHIFKKKNVLLLQNKSIIKD